MRPEKGRSRTWPAREGRRRRLLGPAPTRWTSTSERDGDKIFEHAGAKLVVDRKSFLYLNGTDPDYEESLMESGFMLQNPNVKRDCGCGASFVV